MFDKDSFWNRQASDMHHLPLHVAKFLRDSPSVETPADIPAAEDDMLSWHHVQALCGMVQPYPVRNNKDSAAKHHLLVHQALSIRRPGVDGQVMPATCCLDPPNASIHLSVKPVCVNIHVSISLVW